MPASHCGLLPIAGGALGESEPCGLRLRHGSGIAWAKRSPAPAGAMVDGLTRLRRPPSAEALIARARRRTGLVDFGDIPFARPLQMLLDACRDEADLSLFGGGDSLGHGALPVEPAAAA